MANTEKKWVRCLTSRFHTHPGFQDFRTDSVSDGIKSLINYDKLNKVNLNFDSYYANQEIRDT